MEYKHQKNGLKWFLFKVVLTKMLMKMTSSNSKKIENTYKNLLEEE